MGSKCDWSECESCIYPKNNLLKGLQTEELRVLNEHRNEISFEKGERIIKAHTFPSGLFCINKGLVMLSMPNEYGEEVAVDLIGPGNFIGLADFFGKSSYSIHAIALETTHACAIKKEEVDQLIKSNPVFAQRVIRTLANDLNAYRKRMVDFQTSTMVERLMIALRWAKTVFGVDHTGRLQGYLKRKDWASLSHMSTSNVIRMFNQLQRSGYIDIDNKDLILKDKLELDQT